MSRYDTIRYVVFNMHYKLRDGQYITHNETRE